MDSEDAPHERREVSLTLRCGDITQDFELGSVAEGDSVQTTVLALASSLLKETQESERAPPESPLEARLRNTEALVQATAAMVAALVSSASIGGTSAAPAGMRGGPQWHGSPADAPREVEPFAPVDDEAKEPENLDAGEAGGAPAFGNKVVPSALVVPPLSTGAAAAAETVAEEERPPNSKGPRRSSFNSLEKGMELIQKVRRGSKLVRNMRRSKGQIVPPSLDTEGSEDMSIHSSKTKKSPKTFTFRGMMSRAVGSSSHDVMAREDGSSGLKAANDILADLNDESIVARPW